MTLPPDGDEPEDDLPRIIEPPVEKEHDTRPLKPLWPRRAPAREPGDETPSAATILRQGGPDVLRQLQDAPPVSDESTDRLRIVPRLPNPPAWRVIFLVGQPEATTVGLDVRQTLVIGRGGGDDEQRIGLDLSAHRAMSQGVSRQHAALIPTGEGLLLTDLGSTNGTWVNGEYMEPGHRYPLVAGDRIELGLLRLVVRTVTLISRGTG